MHERFGTARRPLQCKHSSHSDAMMIVISFPFSFLFFSLLKQNIKTSKHQHFKHSFCVRWTYSAAKGYNSDTTMHGFEVGEELTGFSVGTPEFTAYTASYQRAAKLLASTYSKGSSGGGARPALMGPCPGMAWPELATWYPAFLEGTRGALDVAVYHSYNQYVPTGDDKVLYCNTTVRQAQFMHVLCVCVHVCICGYNIVSLYFF